MLSRRSFVGGIGVAVALVTLGRFGSSPRPRVRPASRTPATTANPLDDVGVRSGTKLAKCTVEGVCTLDDGAVALRMRDPAGRPFDLELLAHDDATPGVARAGLLGVYARNNGKGDKATIEEHGLAAMALARHLRAAQARGARLPDAPTLATRS